MFFLYTIIAAVIAAVIGIVVAVRTKKDECVTYTGLDKAGRITNLVLLLVYVCLSPMYLFIGMICTPAHDGYLGFVGYAVSVVIASASLFCFPGLGFSVALRKKRPQQAELCGAVCRRGGHRFNCPAVYGLYRKSAAFFELNSMNESEKGGSILPLSFLLFL